MKHDQKVIRLFFIACHVQTGNVWINFKSVGRLHFIRTRERLSVLSSEIDICFRRRIVRRKRIGIGHRMRKDCRMCLEVRETVEYILKERTKMKHRRESGEEVLYEDGRGIEWMKEV
ncbi:hypothetical protein Zmor_011528 [Zophobas morio]|uniref:Uncharacterized protein n=1 Tax=Zophobas morio TaxID=2755281 RepID=A0AA38IN03_9CUCU|nr:hypothetical protein Zmor_011528 [Zophobas morio]